MNGPTMVELKITRLAREKSLAVQLISRDHNHSQCVPHVTRDKPRPARDENVARHKICAGQELGLGGGYCTRGCHGLVLAVWLAWSLSLFLRAESLAPDPERQKTPPAAATGPVQLCVRGRGACSGAERVCRAWARRVAWDWLWLRRPKIGVGDDGPP